MEKLLLIDGNSIINRAFYALPLLSNQNGEYSNAVYGFTNILIKCITEYKPKYIAVAFDYSKKTFRNDIYAEYKGTRKGMPEELAMQMPIMKQLLKLMKISYFEVENIEADDILGTLATEKDVEKIILSGDRDLFQLIDKTTSVYFTKKGVSEIIKYDAKQLLKDMNLTPEQIIEYKALRGDSSDNIPGINGIGEKTAMELLNEFKSTENLFKNLNKITKPALLEKLENGKEICEISKKLATIKRDVNLEYKLEDLTFDFPFNVDVLNFFKKYEFKSLLRKPELFAGDVKIQEKETQNYEIVKVENIDELEKIKRYIKEEEKFAFNFDEQGNFKFSSSKNFEYQISSEISLFNSTISIENAISSLKEIFENKNILKICYDLKKHKHLLDKFNVEIVGETFDIQIANYLLNNGITENIYKSTTSYFDAYKTLNEEMKNLGVINVFNDIDMPLVDVLYNMEKDGLFVDKNALKKVKEHLSNELEILTNKIYELAGETFKINSPKALSCILFDKLKLVAYNNAKKSTSVEILTQIEDQHEIVSQILRYRKVQKLLATYVEPFSVLAEEDGGFIHTTYSQTLTSTGRISSSEPNLQNLPIRDEEGKNLRELFVSRFSDGNIVSADYNQVELRLMAHYSQDSNMINAYKRGEDIHTSTASLIFNKPFDEISPNERRMAKSVNFGIIYGISEYGLSQNLNISVMKAKNYIERYFLSYPNVKNYMNDCIAVAKEKGYVKTLFGRIRKIPELSSPNKNIVKFGERVAINTPLQGTGADIIKIAMVRVFKKFKENNLKAKLVLQIHDELVVDCPESEVIKVKEILNTEMTNVVNLSVNLPVDISNGKTLKDC